MLSQVGVVDLADIPQMERVRKDLLEKALRFSQSLAQNKDNRLPPVETARAYRRVGDIQGMLGDDLAAESAYLRAVDVLKPRADASPDARRESRACLHGTGRPVEEVEPLRRGEGPTERCRRAAGTRGRVARGR